MKRKNNKSQKVKRREIERRRIRISRKPQKEITELPRAVRQNFILMSNLNSYSFPDRNWTPLLLPTGTLFRGLLSPAPISESSKILTSFCMVTWDSTSLTISGLQAEPLKFLYLGLNELLRVLDVNAPE
jgi:hypothetical protein